MNTDPTPESIKRAKAKVQQFMEDAEDEPTIRVLVALENRRKIIEANLADVTALQEGAETRIGFIRAQDYVAALEYEKKSFLGRLWSRFNDSAFLCRRGILSHDQTR